MIVMGGSLGGSTAVGRVLSALPLGFSEPIAVVLHRHKESEDWIIPILQRETLLPVTEAEDKEPIVPSRVYICPADYHLLVDDGCFSRSVDDLPVSPGPRSTSCSSRPPKGSAARQSRRITKRGGTVLVQDPRTAEGRWMAEAAIVASPHCQVLPLDEIAPALVRHLQASRGL